MLSNHLGSPAKFFFTCATVLMLVACGGGGSGSSGSNSPTQVTLSSSAADLSKYAGVWNSGCGISYNIGSGAQSGRGAYQFGAAVSLTAIPGTVTVTQYSALGCSGPVVRTGTSAVTATFVSSANPVATENASSSSVIYSGNADRLSFQEYNRSTGALIGTAQTRYAAFSNNFAELRVETTSTFSQFDLTYRK
jgi:hypothetical protein